MLDHARVQTYVATPEHAGQTVLAAIRGWRPGTSWSQARGLLARRQLFVNDVVCLDESRRLVAGDQVACRAESAPPPPTATAVSLIYCDEHLLVVEKPSGMVTLRRPEELKWSPAKKALQPTLDELLPELMRARFRGAPLARRADRGSGGSQPQRFPKSTYRRTSADLTQLQSIPTGPADPSESASQQPRSRSTELWPVHRLDRDSSGLLVFARHADVAESLIAQFAAHTVLRVYQAVVTGSPQPQIVRSRLVRDRGDGLRGSTSHPSQGQLAVTHLDRVVDCGPGLSIVECRLETGRTHQIRIHLSELGSPVCGDVKYGRPAEAMSATSAIPATESTPSRAAAATVAAGPTASELPPAPRLALHAWKLAFQHPITGRRIAFEAPLPVELTRWLSEVAQSQKS